MKRMHIAQIRIGEPLRDDVVQVPSVTSTVAGRRGEAWLCEDVKLTFDDQSRAKSLMHQLIRYVDK